MSTPVNLSLFKSIESLPTKMLVSSARVKTFATVSCSSFSNVIFTIASGGAIPFTKGSQVDKKVLSLMFVIAKYFLLLLGSSGSVP